MDDNRLDHIGIAVRSIDDGLRVWRDALGLPFLGVEEVPDQKVRVAMLDAGGPRIELLEPTADDSPIAVFLARRGEGLHHICLGVSDCRSRLDTLAGHGLRLIDEAPRPGAGGKEIGFVHPKSLTGVLLELSSDR